MAYQVLARKYRPQRFSDVVGQDHVTRTLLNALAQNRIAHGYIFSGHRGIGKTTIARILAMALNCRTEIGTEKRPTPEPCEVCESCTEIRAGNATDVIEIDAATNRGIDEIRELRDAARYRPSRDKYKIYILDEAHQITDAAFNALLKTLEEPPEHIVFMMATTQPEDIPQTIRSRCQHFSFHAVKLDDIVGQLQLIARAENILVDDPTLGLLAEAGDGSMRDALSIMDQAIASAPLIDSKPALEIAQVRELMGSVSNVVYEHLLQAVHNNSSADVLNTINRLLDAGNGAPQLARQFVRYLRNTIVAKITNLDPNTPATGIAADLLQISPEERARAARSAALFTEEELSRFLAIMLRTFDDLGFRQEQRFHLELGLLKLVHVQRLIPIEDLLTQLGPPNQNSKLQTPNSQPQAKPALPQPATTAGAPHLAPEMWADDKAKPAPSPFDSDRTRKSPFAASTQQPIDATNRAPVSTPTNQAPVSTATNQVPQGFSLGSHGPERSGALAPAAGPSTEGALALADRPQPTPQQRPHLVTAPEPTILASVAAADATTDLVTIHQTLIAALANTKGQETASEQLEEAHLTLNHDTLEVHTTLSPTMLPVVLNAAAERILKSALTQQNPTLKLKLIPGTPASTTTPKTPKPAAAGSAADLANNHPIVQQARQLFSAEITRVIDLRTKD